MLDGTLPEPAAIIGVARNEMTSAEFAEQPARQGQRVLAPAGRSRQRGTSSPRMLDYVAGEFDDDKPYLALKEKLEAAKADDERQPHVLSVDAARGVPDDHRRSSTSTG